MHIIFHAYSKALIFISTGLPIHRINNFQDYRFVMFQNLSYFSSFKIFLILGSISLIGVYRFCCFHSKEKMLFSIFCDSFINLNFVVLVLACVLTILYSLKIISYCFKFSILNFSFNVVFSGKIFNFNLIFWIILVLYRFSTVLILPYNIVTLILGIPILILFSYFKNFVLVLVLNYSYLFSNLFNVNFSHKLF